MKFDLQVIHPARVGADSQQLERFAFANGRGFPLSYRLFARQYGWGRSLGEFLIYLPSREDHCDSWQQARQRVKSSYLHELDDYADEDGFELALMRRMEPFAVGESGYYLFWDIEQGSLPGEFDIYVSDFRAGLYLAGASLVEVFENLTTPSAVFNKMFGGQPFARTFEGFDGIQ